MRHWSQWPVAAFDTETTGVDPEQARIVSFALLFVRPDGSVSEERSAHSLVDPGCDIPEEAARVHGITREALRERGCVTTAAALAQIGAGLDEAHAHGCPLVVFNSTYDLPLAHAELRREGPSATRLRRLPVLDPLVLDRHFDRWRKGKRNLGAVAERYGVSLGEGAHDARWDAHAAARVLFAMAQMLPALRRFSLAELQDLQRESHRDMHKRMGWPLPHTWPGYPEEVDR